VTVGKFRAKILLNVVRSLKVLLTTEVFLTQVGGIAENLCFSVQPLRNMRHFATPTLDVF
jgi:hypothetical protein